jgi:Flp pilus assembly pilin Flp
VTRISTFRSDQRGAAALELAILAPFLLALVIGVTDLGWTLWQRVQIQEAVQEGAVFAAFAPDDPEGAQARVFEATSAEGLKFDDIYVTCHPGDGEVEVGVTYVHDALLVGGQRTLIVKGRAPVVSMDECQPSG